MTDLRIVTYNVRYFGHSTRGIASTKRAMHRIAEALGALDPLPQIICLQEVEAQSLRSTLAHPLAHNKQTQLSRFTDVFSEVLQSRHQHAAYETYYFPAHSYRISSKTNFYTTGLAILADANLRIDHHNATAPIDITCRHLHPIKSLKQTRICAHLRFRTERDETIDIFNTHLSLPSSLTRAFWTRSLRLGNGQNQLQEARNLISFVNAERKSDRFVVVGDFNSRPGSSVYAHLIDQGRFVDGFSSFHHFDDESSDRWPTAGFMHLRMRLDHIFSGQDIEWIDFKDTRPFDDRTSPFFGLSDHSPIIGTFRMA